MTSAINPYPALVTSYNQRPNFLAMIQALTAGLWELQQLALIIPQLYNIETAQGKQLDVLGQWIGFSRILNLSKEWFSFNEPFEGFDLGQWYYFGAVPYETITLTDPLYRTILQAKILINNFNGARSQFIAILNQLFSQTNPTITVKQTSPMNVTVEIHGQINKVIFFLVTQNVINFTPIGVNITWEFTS